MKKPPKHLSNKKGKGSRYIVMLRRTDTGYSADVPDLPGCVAAAGTLTSARRLIAEAIGVHLDLMTRHGERIPDPSQHIDFAIDDSSEEELCTWVEATMPEIPVAAASRRRRTG
jgi:predicted RNase H-like HicB family nuclease